MSIINTHDITLYGGSDVHKIVLHPLSDIHLPYLYKWCSDPELLFWTEGGANDISLSYDADTVHKIYGGVSQNAFCFLVEADGKPIGECWLQKMNLPYVIEMYQPGTDLHRIDMAIGEKEYWGKRIGTKFIGMIIDFAFNSEQVDILHCFCDDYNIRSRRVWEKHGFTPIRSEELPQLQKQKGKPQYHYRLTRKEYLSRNRYFPNNADIFSLPISALQPSQLYINQSKLNNVLEWFNASHQKGMDPLPIKDIKGRMTLTDGHTRAVAAHISGLTEVPVYIDTDELDMEAYKKCVEWCNEAEIKSPVDLSKRIVSYKEYQHLWLKRCMEL